jgi:hypothetical protein
MPQVSHDEISETQRGQRLEQRNIPEGHVLLVAPTDALEVDVLEPDATCEEPLPHAAMVKAENIRQAGPPNVMHLP